MWYFYRTIVEMETKLTSIMLQINYLNKNVMSVTNGRTQMEADNIELREASIINNLFGQISILTVLTVFDSNYHQIKMYFYEN